MKMWRLAAAASALLPVSLLFALDEKALTVKMKSAGDQMGALRKGMQAGSMPDVAKAARAMVEALDGTEGFWHERKMEDGVQFTKDGLAAAKELAAAAEAGHTDHAKAAMGKLGASCKSCHSAHREEVSKGVYKIK